MPDYVPRAPPSRKERPPRAPPPPNITGYNLTYRGVIYDTDLRIIAIDVNETNNPLTQQITLQRLTAYTNYTIGVNVATVNGSSAFSYIRQRTNESGIIIILLQYTVESAISNCPIIFGC